MNDPVDNASGQHDQPPAPPASGGDAAGRPPLPTWLKVILGIFALIGGLTLLLIAACFGMIAMQ